MLSTGYDELQISVKPDAVGSNPTSATDPGQVIQLTLLHDGDAATATAVTWHELPQARPSDPGLAQGGSSARVSCHTLFQPLCGSLRFKAGYIY